MPTSSRPLVDPQLLSLLDSVPPLELSVDILPVIRSMTSSFPTEPVARPDDVEVAERSVPGPAGAPEVGVIFYAPKERSRKMPCILHIHGGGYVIGDAASMEPAHRNLSLAAGCIIVSVDYRLAPETRFPGAVEDCYAALRWIHTNAGALGIDSTRIGVMGESAGGGLAASLALLARDRGEYPIAFQHLIYPMIDDRTCTASDPSPFVGEFLWTRANNAFGWSSLLGIAPGSPGVSPYAAAARASVLAGLPPAYIATASLDLFLEENVDFARRLICQGVPVELHVYPGAFHGFDLDFNAEVAQQARRDSLAALRRALR